MYTLFTHPFNQSLVYHVESIRIGFVELFSELGGHFISFHNALHYKKSGIESKKCWIIHKSAMKVKPLKILTARRRTGGIRWLLLQGHLKCYKHKFEKSKWIRKCDQNNLLKNNMQHCYPSWFVYIKDWMLHECQLSWCSQKERHFSLPFKK